MFGASPTGQPGQILLRGPSVMSGYWNKPAETAEAMSGGWLHTGDVGVLDPEGYLRIVDRARDMLISGGFNVYPAELEKVLVGLPGLEECAVIGVPDERFGEEVMAWLRVRPGAPVLTAEDLRAFAGGRAAHHLVPRYVRVVDDFPQPVSGHLPRVDLRNLSITELGLERAAGLQHR